MEITIKEAGLADLPLLMEWRVEVLREVFSVSADEPMDDLAIENRNYYQNMLSKGEHIACFAYCGDEVIGCGGICFYQEMPSPDNPNGHCAYLMNIYTRPPFRGQGTGAQIVRWLIGKARDRGVTKIYLETSESGRPLYRKLGFSDMHGYMKLKKTIE